MSDPMLAAACVYKYWRPDPPLPDGADIERFWSYVLIGSPDECWPWRTRKTGTFWWRDAAGGRQHQISSRLAFRLANPGFSLPPDKVIGHRCDWRPCCNPADLECITQRQNSKDMADRGLHPYAASERYSATRERWWGASPSGPGEANNSAKLTDEQVTMIRARYATGAFRQVDLAEEFGIGQSHVSRIVRAEAWSHLEPERS